MTHKEVVDGYHTGKLRILINESAALKLMNTTFVDKPYQYATIFWSWVWMLSIPIGIALIIWVNMWLGIAVIVIGLILPQAIKRSSSENVLEQALRDEEFYNALVEAEIIKIEPREDKSV